VLIVSRGVRPDASEPAALEAEAYA